MLASSVMAMPLTLAAVAALLVFSLSADLVNCQRYIVPEARLEFQNPRGLKISIPGEYLLNLQILIFLDLICIFLRLIVIARLTKF